MIHAAIVVNAIAKAIHPAVENTLPSFIAASTDSAPCSVTPFVVMVALSGELEKMNPSIPKVAEKTEASSPTTPEKIPEIRSPT